MIVPPYRAPAGTKRLFRAVPFDRSPAALALKKKISCATKNGAVQYLP